MVGYGVLGSAARPDRAAHSTATNATAANVNFRTIFRFIDFPFFDSDSNSSFDYITGAVVPSDHLPTGITNSVMGSGPSRNCGFSVTGESGRSAPQEALSVSGK